MKDLEERGLVRNPFPWTCQQGQTTRPRVFSGFSVTVSEIAAEMTGIGGVGGDDVSKPEVRRRGHRHKGESLTGRKIDWSHGMEN